MRAHIGLLLLVLVTVTAYTKDNSTIVVNYSHNKTHKVRGTLCNYTQKKAKLVAAMDNHGYMIIDLNGAQHGDTITIKSLPNCTTARRDLSVYIRD